MSRMLDMFCKKPIKNIDMKTSELIAFQPVCLWNKVKYITVNDINGQRNTFENAEFKVTDNALLIRDKELTHITYTLDNVVKYFYLPDISPHN